MPKTAPKKTGGRVDKALGRLTRQSSKLRKRVTTDLRKLSADAATAVALEKRLRDLEGQIGSLSTLVQGTGASAKKALTPSTRRRSTARPSASRSRKAVASSRKTRRPSKPRAASAKSRATTRRKTSAPTP